MRWAELSPIAPELFEKHRGTFTVGSEPEVSGSVAVDLAGLRLLVTGDAKLICEVLGQPLRDWGAESVFVAPPESAVRALGSRPVDVALLATATCRRPILRLIAEIRRLGRPPVVLLDLAASQSRMVAAREAGAAGYVPDELSLAGLAAGLERVAAGQCWFPSWATECAQVDDVPLTAREKQIHAMLSRGLSVQAIAHRLGVSFRTVEAHKRHVMQKLGCHNVSHLAQRGDRGATPDT